MPCPKCNHLEYQANKPCPNCNFSGDTDQIVELTHIKWMLREIYSWEPNELQAAERSALVSRYTTRLRELEIQLGLRARPFAAEEAPQRWQELIRLEAFFNLLTTWQNAHALDAKSSQALRGDIWAQIKDLRKRLEDFERPKYPETQQEQLEVNIFLLEQIQLYQDEGKLHFLDSKVLSDLHQQKKELEIALGLQSTPEESGDSVEEIEVEAQPEQVYEVPEIADIIPPPPKLPLRERIMRSMLSERTLQAVLFLGIFLLFSAALSFVIWGWQNFSAAVRVAIPIAFTLVFFLIGWYVREKTPLSRSGVAIEAIAALLIPIDFYTVYANYGNPPDYWSEFWLLTSVLCLGAYILLTLNIQSEFFGYLVVTAAGSVVLSTIEIFDLSRDWYPAGLSVLAVVALVIATLLSRRPEPGEMDIFAAPFRYMALLIPGILMPLTLGWRMIDRSTYDSLHYAMTASWLLGSLIFGWGAIYHRSRSLGLLAPTALPISIYMLQGAIFDAIGTNLAWQAFGIALIVPYYFYSGWYLSQKDDAVFQGHGRVLNVWGTVLLIVMPFWALTDLRSGAAAASTHAVLAGAAILAAGLWQRPRYLYVASVLAASATSFFVSEIGFTTSEVSVGWASLAILHVVTAFWLGRTHFNAGKRFITPLVRAGYAISLLAILLALVQYDGQLLSYSLGNWILLTIWGARLAYLNAPGFATEKERYRTRFHWLAALAMPFWLWVIINNQQPADEVLPLALTGLAWGMALVSYRLKKFDRAFHLPWYLTGLVVNHIAVLVAIGTLGFSYTLSFVVLALGGLFLTDAFAVHVSRELFPGGLVGVVGLILLMHEFELTREEIAFGIGVLVTVYFLSGLLIERLKSQVFTGEFLVPLYASAHLLTLVILLILYSRPLDQFVFRGEWTDAMRLWGAGTQLVLGIMYGFFAWGKYKEVWGHVAAWLGAAGGGFIAIILSSGSGRSAVIAAVVAIVYVLAERGLHHGRRLLRLSVRLRAYDRLAWHLYRRPLLFAGWVVSAGAIGLALVRNLWILGGQRIQQTWAVVCLLLVVALYALSARLFRRARFVWLAALVLFVPWTILTRMGWFFKWRFSIPEFAISWVMLAWLLYVIGLYLKPRIQPKYVLPLNVVTQVLLVFALFWGIADVDTGKYSFGLAIGLYVLAAWLDYRMLAGANESMSVIKASRYLYLALLLVPVWCVYLLAWSLPQAQHELYGVMFLAFGIIGVLVGRWFRRRRAVSEQCERYALPAYLTGYLALIVGTMLVAHIPTLLAFGLVYAALVMLLSARLFRNPGWVYPAAIFLALALLLAMHEAEIDVNRQGWGLIALAAVYLMLAWLLRRVKLPAYGTALLATGFALIAFGLPPSSQDQDGALWGYGAAAFLYVVSAFWLRQPLLLTPACALVIVPYAIGIQKLEISSDWVGLSLYPGAVAALVVAWMLDKHQGMPKQFPWNAPEKWPVAVGNRFFGWWGLPLYILGFGLATFSPIFTAGRDDLVALNCLLLMLVFAWAVYRFRLRGWLFASVAAGHLAYAFLLRSWGWWRYPVHAWMHFLPVSVLTALAAIWVMRRLGEKSPLTKEYWHVGWSRPLFLIAAFDILISQLGSLALADAAALITLVNALLIAFWSSALYAPNLLYASSILGLVSLGQWLMFKLESLERILPAYALLTLAYAVIGYGLTLLKRGREHSVPGWLAAWEKPFQLSSRVLSFLLLFCTAVFGFPLAYWSLRAVFGFAFRHLVILEKVRMVIEVFSFIGLAYLARAFAYRRTRLSYSASGLLLVSWLLYAFYIQQWDNLARVQWYVIPTGLYILGVAFLEWRQGNKTLARWLDYTAMLLMLGSLFRQTLAFGWSYALMLGLEGFLTIWWGSARRLRRFLYAGMVGVILATVGQLINSLQSINQWITFGIIGILLVVAAIFIERRLEQLKAWQELLESWE
ncbi:MAG: DUF2157 domain-containing protein [Anaerolineales bacterium]|nr:DUF2157 domain-containing protein [Anaerolineales bacterium]